MFEARASKVVHVPHQPVYPKITGRGAFVLFPFFISTMDTAGPKEAYFLVVNGQVEREDLGKFKKVPGDNTISISFVGPTKFHIQRTGGRIPLAISRSVELDSHITTSGEGEEGRNYASSGTLSVVAIPTGSGRYLVSVVEFRTYVGTIEISIGEVQRMTIGVAPAELYCITVAPSENPLAAVWK